MSELDTLPVLPADPPPATSCGWRRCFRRAAVFVLGSSVLAVGIVMIVTPGPALIFIPLGLGILATEFGWARRWQKWVLQKIRKMARRET